MRWDQQQFCHSRPQSLRSFWPAAGIESSGINHYERTKEITEFWLSGSLRICIYGACLKWLLPELSIPATGQKDRRLWGRECSFVVLAELQGNLIYSRSFVNFYGVQQETAGAHCLIDFAIRTTAIILTK